MMLGATGDRGLGLIIGGRVLAGLGVGGCSNMVPIYISELSPPAIRGRLVGIYELGWQMGGLVGLYVKQRQDYSQEHLTDYHTAGSTTVSKRLWRLPTSSGSFPSPYN
jgi:MFS family permease